MTRSPYHIIDLHHAGCLTEAEADAELETLQIRGGWDGVKYTGYDYRNQRWIVVEPSYQYPA